MELTLIHGTPTDIRVMCDQRYSHTFLLWKIPYPDEQVLFHDPIAYGRKLYQELFSPDTEAHRVLMQHPEQIVLVAEEADLDAIPWEYLFGALSEEEQALESFLVTEIPFVRALPPAQRITLPTVEHRLHIVAVPADPLSEEIARLDVETEWVHLQETVASLPFALTLENAYPPTLMQLRNMVTGQRQRVVHFMGHGQQYASGAVLCFEKENGVLDPVEAQQFVEHMRESVFLVTLNACLSAASGETAFSNLASALVRQKIPYALGMRFRIGDDDARTFSHTFYTHLARGVSVEVALWQARRALYQTRLAIQSHPHLGSVGVPVLYTSLTTPAGFVCKEGKPTIREHQPLTDISTFPRVEGIFQGRMEDLKQLGTYLTGGNYSSLLTIHGGAGLGKTALAREAVKRFAFAWPGGIWVILLEHLPDFAIVVNDLAHFLGIDTQEIGNLDEVEHQVFARLMDRHLLIVLDNAEILVDAIKDGDEAAIALAQFFQQLTSRFAHILATSRLPLGWSGEIVHELGGLTPDEGARFFRQSAPQRLHDIDQTTARKLSELVGGYPSSLRLLGSVFNFSHISLSTYLEENAEQLERIENIESEFCHRSLTNSLKFSIHALDDDLRKLLRGLCILHAPFLPEVAVAIFDPDIQETESTLSSLRSRLHELWERGLLERREVIVRDTHIQLYGLLPITRFYVEQLLVLADERDELMRRFGMAMSTLVLAISQELDHRASAIVLAHQCDADLERGWAMTTGLLQGWYLHQWGWIVSRLGNPQRGIPLFEQALEIFQVEGERAGEAWTLGKMVLEFDKIGERQRAIELCQEAFSIMREIGSRTGEATVLNNMAAIHNKIGQPQRALELYGQALPIMREIGNRAGEAATLNNIALVYSNTGQPQRALELHEQALSIMREIGNRAGEAGVLNNMAAMHNGIRQPQRALELYGQALPIMREIGNRAGEAATLNNIALVYSDVRQLQRALELCEQALPIMREVGDRAGEATTLNNLAGVYKAIGQPQRELELYEQALLIRKEVEDRIGEATTLNNLAGVYRDMEQPQRALELYEQALSIMREVGDHAGEAAVLNGRAFLYRDLQRYDEARHSFETSIQLAGEVARPALVALGLVGLAIVFYRHLNRPIEAIDHLQSAITLLQKLDFPQDADVPPIEYLQQVLATMEQGALPQREHVVSTLPSELVQQIVTITIAVMTVSPEQESSWHKRIMIMQQDLQQRGPNWQSEIEFCTALLDLLAGHVPILSLLIGGTRVSKETVNPVGRYAFCDRHNSPCSANCRDCLALVER